MRAALTDKETAMILYLKPRATPAMGLMVWRLRQRAEKHLRELLRRYGVTDQ